MESENLKNFREELNARAKVYYHLNREKVLKRASQKAVERVNCPVCDKDLAHSSLRVHLKSQHPFFKQVQKPKTRRGESEIDKRESEIDKRESEINKREDEIKKREAEIDKREDEIKKREAEIDKRVSVRRSGSTKRVKQSTSQTVKKDDQIEDEGAAALEEGAAALEEETVPDEQGLVKCKCGEKYHPSKKFEHTGSLNHMWFLFGYSDPQEALRKCKKSIYEQKLVSLKKIDPQHLLPDPYPTAYYSR